MQGTRRSSSGSGSGWGMLGAQHKLVSGKNKGSHPEHTVRERHHVQSRIFSGYISIAKNAFWLLKYLTECHLGLALYQNFFRSLVKFDHLLFTSFDRSWYVSHQVVLRYMIHSVLRTRCPYNQKQSWDFKRLYSSYSYLVVGVDVEKGHNADTASEYVITLRLKYLSC